MTDRELLELAAKAGGLSIEFMDALDFGGSPKYFNEEDGEWWNPLTDDGDALRLAVKLRLYVRYHEALAQGIVNTISGSEYAVNVEDCNRDEYAATRRAIVRAAAEIGR